MQLNVSHIGKSYAAVKAVVDANLSINEGEIRALLGGNGSGKSTLAKIIGGIVGSDKGTISFGNKALSFSSPRKAKDEFVVVTSQELSLFNNLTVEENINMCSNPTKYGFIDKKKAVKQADTILEKLNLHAINDVKVSELPDNKKYMVELAKALVQNPKILIIDEITSALYQEEVDIVNGVLQELKSNGTVIIFISHRMNEIFKMCDSVTVMRNGSTIGTFLLSDISEDRLLELMTGESAEIYKTNFDYEELKSADILLHANEIPIPSYNTKIKLFANKGEIIGVTGLQGHGQTDLLRSLYGLNGHVSFEISGKPVKISNPTDAIKNGLAFVSGDRGKEGAFPDRSIEENLSVVSNLSLKSNANKYSVDSALAEFGVKYNHKKEPITSLSGGNQQKVIVGRWLLAKPILLLADDPSKGIDVAAREDLHSKFINLAKSGGSVVFVSSDNEELMRIASLSVNFKIIVMYEGLISDILEGNRITLENISAASMPSGGVD